MIKKAAVFLALTTASPLLLTGCGEDSGESAKPPEAVSAPVEQASEQPQTTEPATTSTTPTQAPAPTNPVSSPLSDELLREAEKAGWTTHRDETGNVFLTPPGKGLPEKQ